MRLVCHVSRDSLGWRNAARSWDINGQKKEKYAARKRSVDRDEMINMSPHKLAYDKTDCMLLRPFDTNTMNTENLSL